MHPEQGRSLQSLAEQEALEGEETLEVDDQVSSYAGNQ